MFRKKEKKKKLGVVVLASVPEDFSLLGSLKLPFSGSKLVSVLLARIRTYCNVANPVNVAPPQLRDSCLIPFRIRHMFLSISSEISFERAISIDNTYLCT